MLTKVIILSETFVMSNSLIALWVVVIITLLVFITIALLWYLRPRCSHAWKVLSETKTESQFEQSNKDNKTNPLVINRNSWHFKCIAWFETYPSHSLCIYFWQVIWSLLKGLGIGVIIGMVLSCMLFTATFFVSWLFDGLFYLTTDTKQFGGILGIGTLLWIFLIFIGSLVIYSEYLEEYCSKNYSEYVSKYFTPKKKCTKPNLTKLNLTKEYLKAKKEKICPLITFED